MLCHARPRLLPPYVSIEPVRPPLQHAKSRDRWSLAARSGPRRPSVYARQPELWFKRRLSSDVAYRWLKGDGDFAMRIDTGVS